MKIRITTNNLRFRLSRGEVEKLGEGGRLEEKIRIGEQELIYTLQARETAKLSVQIQQHLLIVVVPQPQAHGWAVGFEVGIYASVAGVEIAIEKDFKCLHGPTENEAECFPNPLEQTIR
jgi:hypothetical protein